MSRSLPLMEGPPPGVTPEDQLVFGARNLTDMILNAMGRLVNVKRGADRYIEHNERIFSILEQSGFTHPAIKMQTGVHDYVKGLDAQEPATTQAETRLTLKQWYEAVQDDSRVTFVTSVGYAIGGRILEAKAAEGWRHKALARIDEMSISDAEKILRRAAITKEIPEGVDPKTLGNVLKGLGFLDLDIGNLDEVMEGIDVEDVPGKAAELIDNLRHPPPDNSASAARDCIEALSCYVPLLELLRLDKLAIELSDLAYQFLLSEVNPAATENARAQHRIAKEYEPLVGSLISAALDSAMGQFQGEAEASRFIGSKSLGSHIKKLATDEEYAKVGATQVNDSTRGRLIVKDEHDNLEDFDTIAEAIKEHFRATTDHDGQVFAIEPFHPLGMEKADKNYAADAEGKLKPNGYKARHLSFKMSIAGGQQVLFEIQIVGASQHEEHIWGPASHIFFKHQEGTEMTPQQLTQVQKFKRRAEHLNAIPYRPALNPRMWAELLRQLPDFDTPLHEVFALNARGDMVAKDLADVEINDPGLPEKAVLPAAHLTREQFTFMLSLLDESLGENPMIRKAVDMIYDKQGNQKPRRNGDPVVEGHLLPTALHAALVATTSGRRWEKPDEAAFMSRTIVAALLHDLVEDAFEKDHDAGYAYIKEELGEEFGSQIVKIIRVLTLSGIEDEAERRTDYAENLQKDINEEALYIKLSDRMQNHTSDLVTLTKILSHAEISAADREEISNIDRYIVKTDTNLTVIFDALHPAYKLTKDIVWSKYRHLKRALDARLA